MKLEKKHFLFGAAVAVVATILGTVLVFATAEYRTQAKPCQKFDLLNPAAAQSAIKLAKQYPVHSDPNQGFAEPAPEKTFFDSVSCNVVFSQADRPAWAESFVRPAGYRCEGGFDFCIWLSPGLYQKVAKKGDTLRKLGGWDDRAGRQACVFDPKSDQSLMPGPDDPLPSGAIVAFC